MTSPESEHPTAIKSTAVKSSVGSNDSVTELEEGLWIVTATGPIVPLPVATTA